MSIYVKEQIKTVVARTRARNKRHLLGYILVTEI